jgi:hypothetical protein
VSKGSKPKVEITKYYMSLHYGIAMTLDRISQIDIKEKIAWKGNIAANTTITIDKPGLFGGQKKEGGIEARFSYFAGGATQTIPSTLAARCKVGGVARTTANMPAYRGISSIWFYEKSGTSRKGAYWGANDPTIPPAVIRGHRTPDTTLPSGEAKIARSAANVTKYAQDHDVNPAHIILECFTNEEWGMGEPLSSIDFASFQYASTVLFNEGFGLSIIWMEQSTIEEFVQEIIDHIDAVIYIAPKTGLLTLKLIRGDYDVRSLPSFSPHNAKITRFSRKQLGETVNQITVTFTNWKNDEEDTVLWFDSGNIAAQGKVVTDSRNFHAIHRKDLAAKVSRREGRQAAALLAIAEMEADRSAWSLNPGDVCIVHSPEDDVNEIVMRVINVDYGKAGDSYVRASLTEDIFGLQHASFGSVDETEDDNDTTDPTPADYVFPYTLSWFETRATIDTASADYPEVTSAVLAAQIAGSASDAELHAPVTDAAGNTSVEQVATINLMSRGTLTGALTAQAASTIAFLTSPTPGPEPSSGNFVLIGQVAESDFELCLITAVGTSDFTVTRGVLDTTPKAWAAGTVAWIIDADSPYTDDTVRSAAETVPYQVLPIADGGVLDLADAPVVNVTLSERPWLPLRPANVKVNSVGFGTADVNGLNPIPVSWSERNRLTEDSVVLAWTDASVTGETGQTTRIVCYSTADAVLFTITGIAGSSYDLLPSAFGGATAGYVKVLSERDGFVSLQGHRIDLVNITSSAASAQPIRFSGVVIEVLSDAEAKPLALSDLRRPLVFTFVEKTIDNLTINIAITEQYSIPAGATGSFAMAGTPAAVQTDILIKKNGATIGTVRYAASASTATFISFAATTLAPNDTLTAVFPSSADASLANGSINILAGYV